MSDEELVALFLQAYRVELEFSLPAGYSIEGREGNIITCAVYLDNRELPGGYLVGPIREALIQAERRPLSYYQRAGHVTWTWGRC